MQRWGASLGLGAAWYCGTCGRVVRRCKLLMVGVVAVMNLQLGSHDYPKGHVEVRSWKLVDPLVGALCCTAKLVFVVAVGLGSSY